MTSFAHSTKRPFLVILLAFLFWLGLQFAAPLHVESAAARQQMILVKYAADSTATERAAIVSEVGGTVVDWLAPLHTAQVQVSNSDRRAVDAARAALSKHPSVLSVEYDETLGGIPVEQQQRSPHEQPGTIPPSPVQVDDPDFNDPQRVYAPQIIELTQAWGYTMGTSEAVVAVVDSGVNSAHPDLQGNVLPGWDFVNEDDDPFDDHGHGTHVAGIIAARANNGIGSAGICPNCKILPVKVLDENNVGSWFGVAEGIVYAVDNGADVINLSLGGPSSTQIIQDAVAYASQYDVLVVAAAGNSRTDDPFYPAALEAVLAVSATRRDDTRWSLSNFGTWVDVAAPGYAIFSTYADLTNYYGGYTFMSGTSMAAPHVAGLAGLLLSQNPDRTAEDLRRLILENADDLGTPGPDDEFGNGRINAQKALVAEAPLPKANAALGGLIWLDSNVNGQWEQGEQPGSVAVVVHVYDSTGVVVGTSSADGTGEWRVGGLYPGRYKVRAETSGRVVLTSEGERIVDLVEGQTLLDINFGATIVEPSQQSYQTFVPGVYNPRTVAER